MKKTEKLSHLDASGKARMVDVGAKAETDRMARAEVVVEVGKKIADLLRASGGVAKGNVIETARVAGVMAAKRTAELIPMCHPIALDIVEIDCALRASSVVVTATARCRARTGVEMEAMTAAAVAALTIYDMCKSAGKGIAIRELCLLEKTGGKSGDWRAKR